MDHDDVLEQLQLAALEPGGLDRLTAGDTAAAAAIAGHLAGCEPCAGELERLRRAVPLLRDVIRTTPAGDLRDRTLALVRERGVARDAERGVTRDAERGSPPEDRAPGRPGLHPGTRRGPTSLPWVAAIAAAVLLSVTTTSLLVGQGADRRAAEQSRVIASLGRVTSATLAISAGTDAKRVALTGQVGATIPEGGAPTGTLLFSPSTTQLVVVAQGLPEPPSGREYRCWVEIDGRRQDVGRMSLGGGVAYWTGATPAVSGVPPGTRFGVSLTDIAGGSLDADPVIEGRL